MLRENDSTAVSRARSGKEKMQKREGFTFINRLVIMQTFLL